MKILLTNDFSKNMAKQPKEELQTFIEYVDKLASLTKKEILSLMNWMISLTDIPSSSQINEKITQIINKTE